MLYGGPFLAQGDAFPNLVTAMRKFGVGNGFDPLVVPMSAAAALNHGWFTKHAPELASADLTRTLANLKKWNARRKLEGAARTVAQKLG